ncbi:hypothetical protein MTO96_015654 [Rhipicephalus appendiculatus]
MCCAATTSWRQQQGRQRRYDGNNQIVTSGAGDCGGPLSPRRGGCSSAATPTAAVVNVSVPRDRRPRTTTSTRDQREEVDDVGVSTSSLVSPPTDDQSVL